MIGGMNSHYLPKYLEHFWKAESLSDHFIGWKLSFSSPGSTLQSQSRTQWLFIYLFQRLDCFKTKAVWIE